MDFKEAQILIRENMLKHKLINWTVKFNRKTSILGSCNPGIKNLNFSKVFIEHNSKELVLNTILHEIAHALDPEVMKAPHGRNWKTIALSIRCDGKRLANRLNIIQPPDMKDAILPLFDSGLSHTEIIKNHNIPGKTVRAILRKYRYNEYNVLRKIK